MFTTAAVEASRRLRFFTLVRTELNSQNSISNLNLAHSRSHTYIPQPPTATGLTDRTCEYT